MPILRGPPHYPGLVAPAPAEHATGCRQPGIVRTGRGGRSPRPVRLNRGWTSGADVGDGLEDLHRAGPAVGQRVGGLLAHLLAHDGGAEGRLGRVDVNMLVAWPLGKACSITCPTEGLSTYSVRPTAAGTATAAKTAPDHLRVATQATTSARVISATGLSVPRSGSHEGSAGARLSPAWIRGSSAESSRPGCPWPTDCSARAAVTAAHAASSVEAGRRSHLGSHSCQLSNSTAQRRPGTPRYLRSQVIRDAASCSASAT
jgi:hypothetical protein